MFSLRLNIARRSSAAVFANASRSLSVRSSLLAQGDYGSPHGDPKAANPQEQGENPKVDLEHPGPSPPSAASKGSSQGASQSSSQSQKSSSQSKNGAQPKIHNESPPSHESEDVKKHNEDFAKRSGKQSVEDSEKVDPKFWKGHADDKPT